MVARLPRQPACDEALYLAAQGDGPSLRPGFFRGGKEKNHRGGRPASLVRGGVPAAISGYARSLLLGGRQARRVDRRRVAAFLPTRTHRTRWEVTVQLSCQRAGPGETLRFPANPPSVPPGRSHDRKLIATLVPRIAKMALQRRGKSPFAWHDWCWKPSTQLGGAIR